MLKSNALIVDSSISTRNYVRRLLQQDFGCNEIHEAKNVDDAFRVLKSGHIINWIFSTVAMPGLSPLDLLGSARNSAHPRFVLMSSAEHSVTREVAIQKSAADYLYKPFLPSELANVVHRLKGLEEQRSAVRSSISLACEINIGFDSLHQYGAELTDISMLGCRMKTSQVKPGSGYIDDLATVTLRLENGTSFHVQAQIKRLAFNASCTDPLRNTEIAIAFIDVTPPLKEKLVSFINSSRKKLPPNGKIKK
jgi:CheY-like chemotaxis protein